MSAVAVCLLLGAAAVADIAPVRTWTIDAIDAAVVDRANALGDAERKQLGDLLEQHRARTGVQMAILVVGGTDGVTLEEYSRRAADDWSGGRGGRDDGVLLVVAMEERRMRLELGAGIEPHVTNPGAGRLTSRAEDELRNGRVAAALRLVVDGVIAATEDVEYEMGAIRKPSRLVGPPGVPPEDAVLLAGGLGATVCIVLLLLIRRRRARRNEDQR